MGKEIPKPNKSNKNNDEAIGSIGELNGKKPSREEKEKLWRSNKKKK